MDTNGQSSLSLMLRERYAWGSAPMQEEGKHVSFASELEEAIEFDAKISEAVKFESDAKEEEELDLPSDDLPKYRMALAMRTAMARKQLGHLNVKLAVARAKHLRKSLKTDDETHLGFYGLGVMERRVPIEKVRLPCDDEKKKPVVVAVESNSECDIQDSTSTACSSNESSPTTARLELSAVP
eukprot:TRINITY_DN48932_c0_g1_i1.p1 TRINITY_DN48932_c0_g1~~TRINITY_DN48932_c0_g1_i1.p1  ORF type:complete len:183 (+),score=45.44 TRINITY_DN48932_c0_g1_i1:102-650(+)